MRNRRTALVAVFGEGRKGLRLMSLWVAQLALLVSLCPVARIGRLFGLTVFVGSLIRMSFAVGSNRSTSMAWVLGFLLTMGRT